MVKLLFVRLLPLVLLFVSCMPPPESAPLTVAAAANLSTAFNEIGKAFQNRTGVPVVFSFASTAQLVQQIENGAPFDLFAAADTAHLDDLLAKRKIRSGSRAIYAIGQLALWIPNPKVEVRELKDLASHQVRYIAVADPVLAPYGEAAIATLRRANLFAGLQSKIVYANSISQTKQLAASGNADVALTAYSLVFNERGTVLKVDARLEQALGIVASSPRAGEAGRFRAFLLGAEGRAILSRNGYLLP